LNELRVVWRVSLRLKTARRLHLWFLYSPPNLVASN
jgi:hypothetical protein